MNYTLEEVKKITKDLLDKGVTIQELQKFINIFPQYDYDLVRLHTKIKETEKDLELYKGVYKTFSSVQYNERQAMIALTKYLHDNYQVSITDII
jgi:hypothetical protein